MGARVRVCEKPVIDRSIDRCSKRKIQLVVNLSEF